MDPPPGEEADFDDWYQREHIPARMGIRGFHSAIRARAVQGEPSHLAVYLLDDLAALETPEYRGLKEQPSDRTRHMLETVPAFTRWIGDEIADTGEVPLARYLYLVTFAVPEAHLGEFDRWYDEEHVPMLMRNGHWQRCRRYAITSGEPEEVSRAAIHELADLKALESPERTKARSTAWRAELAKHGYFASVRYAVYERFQDFRADSA